MARLVKVGSGGNEVTWHKAMLDLRADDVLLLQPGFYILPQGKELTDITIKGLGVNPEDTTITSNFVVSPDSRYLTLENLCLEAYGDRNAISVSPEANSYLTLRNCIVKGAEADAAALAINGKVTVELYSTKILNGSVSFFKTSDFRLEMSDSLIDYPSDEYCALAIEGKGTAIINNSEILGSINTFDTTNAEIDINNSRVNFMILDGQTWMNMFNVDIVSDFEPCLYIGGDCWVNIMNSQFAGAVYFDKKTTSLVQNCRINKLLATGESRMTLMNCIIEVYADFQGETDVDANLVTFNGDGNYQYFLVLSKDAKLHGSDLIFNPNSSELAIKDNSKLNVSILSSSISSLEIECAEKNNVNLLGLKWTEKKP